MTVADLISQLQKCDPKSLVVYHDDDTHVMVRGVEQGFADTDVGDVIGFCRWMGQVNDGCAGTVPAVLLLGMR